MHPPPPASAHGLTLIELMLGVLVLGVLVVVVAPSMRELITVQRLRGINAELVTDLQFARSEAARRNRTVQVGFGANGSLSCYVTYVEPVPPPIGGCDCSLTPGVNVCSGAGRDEIKTVQVPRTSGVAFSASSADGAVVRFDGQSGALTPAPGASAASPFEVLVSGEPRGQLRTRVTLAGSASVCSPGASISGVPSC